MGALGSWRAGAFSFFETIALGLRRWGRPRNTSGRMGKGQWAKGNGVGERPTTEVIGSYPLMGTIRCWWGDPLGRRDPGLPGQGQERGTTSLGSARLASGAQAGTRGTESGTAQARTIPGVPLADRIEHMFFSCKRNRGRFGHTFGCAANTMSEHVDMISQDRDAPVLRQLEGNVAHAR